MKSGVNVNVLQRAIRLASEVSTEHPQSAAYSTQTIGKWALGRHQLITSNSDRPLRPARRLTSNGGLAQGGRYRMDEGQIVVDSVMPIRITDITHDLARESGFNSVDDLLLTAWDTPVWRKRP
jgi:hypothetical protein